MTTNKKSKKLNGAVNLILEKRIHTKNNIQWVFINPKEKLMVHIMASNEAINRTPLLNFTEVITVPTPETYQLKKICREVDIDNYMEIISSPF